MTKLYDFKVWHPHDYDMVKITILSKETSKETRTRNKNIFHNNALLTALLLSHNSR